MKPIHPLRTPLLFLATAGAGCLFAAIAVSGPSPSEQAEKADAPAIAAIRRDVVDPLDAPILLAIERENNRRIFSRVRIPESGNPAPAPPFHSVEILTASHPVRRGLQAETPSEPSRVPFRIHRVDPVEKTSRVVATGYFDALAGQVFLLDAEKGTNVPAAEHPLVKSAVG